METKKDKRKNQRLREPQYPYPSKRIAVKGGSASVSPNATPETIEAVKKLAELAYEYCKKQKHG